MAAHPPFAAAWSELAVAVKRVKVSLVFGAQVGVWAVTPGSCTSATPTNPAFSCFLAKEAEESYYHASTSSGHVVTNALARKSRSPALGDLQ